MKNGIDIPEKATTAEKIDVLHKQWDKLRANKEAEFSQEQSSLKEIIGKKIHERLSMIVGCFKYLAYSRCQASESIRHAIQIQGSCF